MIRLYILHLSHLASYILHLPHLTFASATYGTYLHFFPWFIDDKLDRIDLKDETCEELEKEKIQNLEMQSHQNEISKDPECSIRNENVDHSINCIANTNSHLSFSENLCAEKSDNNENDTKNYEQIKIQYNELINKSKDYENEIVILNNKLEECEIKCQFFMTKIKNEEDKNNKQEKKYCDLEYIIKKKDIEFKECIEKLNKDINNKNGVIEELEKCVEEYKNKLSESQDFFIRNEKRSIESLENKVSCLKNKLKDSTNENISLLNKNNELNKIINDLKMSKEENEKNIENLKYNMKINQHESFSNIEKIQKQNTQIELLSNENIKNEKIIDLLKNDKLKIEEENNILKKNLLTTQDELKKIEQHSYDIYEMKNYLETILDKHKNVMDQLESEKNQKENLKIKIKSFLTEIKNSAIAIKMYKMKCSFFINIIKNYEYKISILENKLKTYEFNKQKDNEKIHKKNCKFRKTQNEKTSNSENLHSHDDPKLASKLDSENLDGENLDGENLDGENLDGENLGGENFDELLEEKLGLEEKIEKEINKKEEALNKLNSLETILKEKNFEINEKNYKINRYKLLNKNLEKSIKNYEHNINLMKENIHKLEKENELKEIKNLIVPPKIIVNISKLSSFENNFKNELKELIGTSSNFLGNTFKYINENPLKKNLQTNPFFFSSSEKKNDNNTQIINNKKDNLISSYINDTVDVTGFAKNFIYNNMNKIPNFINDNSYKSEEYQNELAKNEHIFSEQSDEKQLDNSSLLSDAIWNKQNGNENENENEKGNSYEEKQPINNYSNIGSTNVDDPNDKDNGKNEKNDNKYIDLFMGKINMNTQGNKHNEKPNDGQVSQFFTNTENKIKDLFDLGRKKNYNKPKEKTDSFQDNVNDTTTFTEKLFGNFLNIDNNNNNNNNSYDIKERNFIASQNDQLHTNQIDKFMENEEKLNTEITQNNFYINKEKTTQKFNINEENKDDPELAFSGDDAQINDVWDEEIDLDNF
ncbi:rhoptry protein, putative [Plasmodium yoelii]|uniref:Rhoptry protein, putative n=1 Tax=Plasmodium yoelii TaxID=5861 RepID=A0A077Y9V2_PLAYE|nr:rhoptry protein, putative [Plasmodium yoelii]